MNIRIEAKLYCDGCVPFYHVCYLIDCGDGTNIENIAKSSGFELKWEDK